MILIVISFTALVYSLSVQILRKAKSLLIPKYKKTPEYQAFLKELNNLIKNS